MVKKQRESSYTKRISRLENVGKELQNLECEHMQEELKHKTKTESKFEYLSHHISSKLLRKAFRKVCKSKGKHAAGVDGINPLEYGRKDLSKKLGELLMKVKNRTYEPKSIKRTTTTKLNGEERPLGIQCVEDRILQCAITMILEPIYDPGFREFSFGYRPNRSIHEAISYLQNKIGSSKKWKLLDMDLEKCFDSIPHEQLMKIINKRIQDPTILDLLDNWLKAGIKLPDGDLEYTENGTPQGAILSGLLANIYLDEVIDKWFVEVFAPSVGGKCFMVRYCDDVIIGMEADQEEELKPKIKARLDEYDLSLNEAKTNELDFVGTGAPEQLRYLGFNICIKDRLPGRTISIKIPKDKLAAKLLEIDEILANKQTLKKKYERLNLTLRGACDHYSFPGCKDGLKRLRNETMTRWCKFLMDRELEPSEYPLIEMSTSKRRGDTK